MIKIRNWPDDRDSIQDDTPLVRYMRLEAFLMLLLQNSVFIPTLGLLQSTDKAIFEKTWRLPDFEQVK